MRKVLIVAGAPRVPVDAVRYLTVSATGNTAKELDRRLMAHGVDCDLLLSVDACPDITIAHGRYADRSELDQGVESWLGEHPEGVVVLSAAINDYQVQALRRREGDTWHSYAPADKLPSRGDEVVVHLTPAPKLVDQLPSWGHRGPLVAFKYEAAETVLDSAEALRQRSSAACVVANSIDGSIQALVDGDGVHDCAGDRKALLTLLSSRIGALSSE
jgi:phosphopantothenoylcysteine synthetase/decarboxylase